MLFEFLLSMCAWFWSCRVLFLLRMCAGFWSRHVGEMSAPAVAVPIQPAEHYHLHTKPVPDLPPDTPVVRDPDGFVYFRENEGRFLAGGFEPRVSKHSMGRVSLIQKELFLFKG